MNVDLSDRSNTRHFLVKNVWQLKPGVFVLWLLWPFGALLRTIKNFQSTTAKFIIWLFCLYYGSAFIVPEDKPGAGDSARYAREFVAMHESPIPFNELTRNLYEAKTGFVDIYQPILTWIISRITGNPRWLFIVFSAVFGFFYVSNLWILFEQIKSKPGLVLIIFLLSVALINPIWYINGVRMYTASQVFIFGILHIIFLERKQGLIWVILSVFIHFSFLFPVTILLTFLFLPRNIIFFFIFFILTSINTELDLLEVRESMSFLPAVFQPRVNIYTNPDFYEHIVSTAETRSWHVLFATTAERWITYIWLIAIFTKRKNIELNSIGFTGLYGFTLYLTGWAQIAALMPSGKRFFLLSDFFVIFMICMILFEESKKSILFHLARITVPFILFVMLFKIRIGMGYTGIMAFFGNFPLTFIFQENTTLIDHIKYLF